MTTVSDIRPATFSQPLPRQTRMERTIEASLPFAGPATAFLLMVAATCSVAIGS